ncbi:MAG: DNA polymerase III subunit chi [Pseudorhodoplanes sp.]|jgi:DNA polymerase III subunit chi
MTEVRFYHLIDQRLERVLPQLLEVSLSRGWRVVVQAASEERVEAIDAQLWTYRDDSFLPHGVARGPDATEQPVLITADAGNPNGANVRFLVDNAPIPDDADKYERLVLIFDGNDDDAVALARERWTHAKSKGFEASYWQPDESGRWVQKA